MDINQVWPEWNEDCVLGEGSFGKVYRAKRVEYGRTFYSAIKVLTVPKSQQEIKFARSQGMNDSEIYDYFSGLVENLLNEITLMDNLKGAQNIVGIEDYKIIERQGEIGWDIFIRMELLSPFDSFVSNPEFSQKDVIRLGVDICTALEVCEQNYIVHRDIKPDNIFISRFGEYKLGDFGIARKLEATQANLSRKGTLNYMAPEVYKSEEYGPNVDIYSLGLVLYSLLNNNRIAFLPPYPQPISYQDNEEALAQRLSGAPMTPPCNANSSLGAVIVKACAYRPEDRYQTATEFKNALINEWNVLVQSGDDREISSDALRFAGDSSQRYQSTTNDMTANGQLVVDGYVQGTTVLDYSAPSAPTEENQSKNLSLNVPEGYSSAKSNKICRMLAWLLAVAVCVFAGILFFEDSLQVETSVVSAFLCLGVLFLATDRNRVAIGGCVTALSLPYVSRGLSAFLTLIEGRFPVQSLILVLSGFLVLCSGIVIMTQKEVRFGGSLCVYAVAIEWMYHIYNAINGAFAVELWRIFFGIAVLTVFLWSYGYKSDAEISKVKKILHIVGIVAAVLVLLQAVLLAIPVVMINA